MKTMAWYEKQAKTMDEAYARQEFQIDFGATSGQQIYHLTDEYTIEDDFIVPRHWTRRMILDPHPRKPFASLWLATEPDGFSHVYREFWPSKIYGRPGRVPEDDNRVSIPNYVECCAWFESKDNPKNIGHENLYERVIDYAARAFKQQTANAQNVAEINYQELIENAAEEVAEQRDAQGRLKYPNFSMRFTDAKKADKGAGISLVNEMLLPLEVLKADGTGYEKRSKLRIMRSCTEIIWQLKHNRIASQTSHQKELTDPEMKVLQVRNDLSDCLLYAVRNGLEYIAPHDSEDSTWIPAYEGVSY
jgi:hypothetical protein